MQNSREINDLKKLIARLHSQTPLIGWELRRMAVNALAKNGSPEAMDALADVFSHSADQRVHQMALEVLQNLAAEGNAGAQEALCRLMVAHQHPLAREIVLAAQYAPHDPKQRARFVNTLTEILIHSADSKVHRSIIRILTKIAEEGRLEAQEALCRLVIEYHHPLAREIVLAAQYAPRDPLQRALLYILTAQWDKYEQLDFDHHLLRTAYNAVDKKLQKRIVVSARQGRAGRSVSVVCRRRATRGSDDGRRLAGHAGSAEQTWGMGGAVAVGADRACDLEYAAVAAAEGNELDAGASDRADGVYEFGAAG